MDKHQLLESRGYHYDSDHRIYGNGETKKIFSFAFVEDSRTEELQDCLQRDTSGDWRFYSTEQPRREPTRELVALFTLE